MDEINNYIKDEKTKEGMKRINENPILYTKIFTNIYKKLCRHCLAKVHRKFLKKQNTNFKEYCKKCQTMAEEEYKKWTT